MLEEAMKAFRFALAYLLLGSILPAETPNSGSLFPTSTAGPVRKVLTQSRSLRSRLRHKSPQSSGLMFEPVTLYSSGAYESLAVAVGDVNGDGKPDLVVTDDCASSINCVSGLVSVLLGNGDGTFQTAVTYGSGGLTPISVTIGDVNGDG